MTIHVAAHPAAADFPMKATHSERVEDLNDPCYSLSAQQSPGPFADVYARLDAKPCELRARKASSSLLRVCSVYRCYLHCANLNPLLITGMQPGGSFTTTTIVENVPGFSVDLEGSQLMTEIQEQATRFGAHLKFLFRVESADFLWLPVHES